MFNIKWSALAGGFAFTLSLLVGLVTRVGLVALVRALVFGVLFFVLGSLIRALIKMFLPELLLNGPAQPSEDTAGEEAGSRVDITVDDDVPADDAFDRLPEEDTLDDGALDQIGEDGYTQREEAGEGLSGGAPKPPVRSRGEGGEAGAGREAGGRTEPSDSIDALLSFEGGLGLLPPAPAKQEEEAALMEEEPPVRVNPPRNSAAKSPVSDNDFNPKEMAQAIQTILQRDNKG